MSGKTYVLANLNDDQLRMLREAEQTLTTGIDILAFQSAESEVAPLDPSQLECLQGLEQKLGLTLIAYRKV